MKKGIETGLINIPVYTLDSVPLHRKFSSLFDVFYSILTHDHKSKLIYFSSPSEYFQSRLAMVILFLYSLLINLSWFGLDIYI
jgi:hypothetical protein